MKEALARYALVVLLAVGLLVAALLAGCDATYTVRSDCLYPDSIVTRPDGTIVTYWPPGCP